MAPAKGTRAGRRARSMTAVPPLATARLRLRALTVDDAEAMFPTLSDSSLMTWWSRAPFASIEEVRDYFAPRPDLEGWRCWAYRSEERSVGEEGVGTCRSGWAPIA